MKTEQNSSVIRFKESEIRRYAYSNSTSIVRIENGKVQEIDKEIVFDLFKKHFFDNSDIYDSDIYELREDLTPSHFNGKVGKGRHLMVINDHVIYRKGRPYWLTSKKSCENFLKSIINNYKFKKDLNLEPYLYHTQIPPVDAIYLDMIQSDFIEIFYNNL